MLEEQPSVTTIRNQRQASKRRLLWVLCFGLLLDGLLVIAFLVLNSFNTPSWLIDALIIGIFSVSGTVMAVFIMWLVKLHEFFWKELAAEYKFTYTFRPYFQNHALLFREGSGRHTGHGISGTLENQAFRLFEYYFSTGQGKSRQTHSYLVFEIVFSGTFPHIYLNNERNRDLSGFKDAFLNRITLPASFDKQFNLYGPKGYEIEVLEVMTPDVVARLADEKWEHDTELVDGKLYVFREQMIRIKADLEKELARLRQVVKILAPKLNRMSLTPIGDLPHTL